MNILQRTFAALAGLMVLSVLAVLPVTAQYNQSVFDLKRASDLYDTRGYTSGKGISVDGKLIISNANGAPSYSYPISSHMVGGHEISVALNYCPSVSFSAFTTYQQASHPGGGTHNAGGIYAGWGRFHQNRPAYIISVNNFAVNVIATAGHFHADSASRLFKSGVTNYTDADLSWVIDGYDFCNRMYDFGAVGAQPNGGNHFVDEISILRGDGSLLRLMNVQPTSDSAADKRPELYTGYYYPNEANEHGFGYVEFDTTYWRGPLRGLTTYTEAVPNHHFDTLHLQAGDGLPARDSIAERDTSYFIRNYSPQREWSLIPRKLHYYDGSGLEYVFREVRAPYGVSALRDLVSRGGGYYGGPTIFYLEDILGSAGPVTGFTRARHYPIFGNPLFEKREDTTRGRALITQFAGHQLSFDYNTLIIEGLGRTTKVVFDTIARSGNAGSAEMMPFANNGGLTPASLTLAQYGETNPALYKSFVGYVTKIVDPEGRVTSFEYEPITRTYQNMGFPREYDGGSNINLTLKNSRLKAINEPAARYVLRYYGGSSETITQATETASDGPQHMNDVVDSVLKFDPWGNLLTVTRYYFQYAPNNFTTMSQEDVLDKVAGLGITRVYDYRQIVLPNLAPLLPPARFTELYRVREVAGDTTVTTTAYTTLDTLLPVGYFGTNYLINASSMPSPYLILPSATTTTINGVTKSRTAFTYTADTVRKYGGG